MTVYTTDLDSLRRDIDVAVQVARYMPDEAPWTAMLMQARKKGTSTAEFNWFEEDVYGYWTQINNGGGYNGSATSIVVDDGTLFAAKDIAKIPRTGEILYISAVSTNTLTVVRGYGETSGATINDDDYIVNLGNAMEENSNTPAQKLKQPTKVTNYCGITRTPFGASGTTQAERQVTTEAERARLTRSKGIDHRLAIERQLLFGEKKEDTSNKRRMTRGVEKFISTNVYDAGGTLTESEFDLNICEPVFRYGSKTKVLIASPRLVSIINGWGKEKLQVSEGVKRYGLKLREYVSPHGTLVIAPSKALEQYYAYHSFAVDMMYIWIRTLRDTRLRRNIQDNDLDGFIDEYLSELGFMLEVEKAHATLKNATG